jgi:hypothetical protein
LFFYYFFSNHLEAPSFLPHQSFHIRLFPRGYGTGYHGLI